jgi:four helix bundle protein
MRRAANSMTHNIAEGFGRYEAKDKTRFYKIPLGSSYELMSQSLASYELKFIKEKNVLDELISSSKAIIEDLNSLIKPLENRGKPQPLPQEH